MPRERLLCAGGGNSLEVLGPLAPPNGQWSFEEEMKSELCHDNLVQEFQGYCRLGSGATDAVTDKGEHNTLRRVDRDPGSSVSLALQIPRNNIKHLAQCQELGRWTPNGSY